MGARGRPRVPRRPDTERIKAQLDALGQMAAHAASSFLPRTEHEALMADSVSSKALAAALKLRGHNIAYNTIQRHRRRDCACHESA